MRPFRYERAESLSHAIAAGGLTGQGQSDAPVQFLAGGVTLVDLMKLDVLRPARVIDIGMLRADHSRIEVGAGGLRLGALATMADTADHPDVIRDYPALAQSLRLAASSQLRNMASLGGNVLQRTRCIYYRDTSWAACNKRAPGSGCSALQRATRDHAVLGVDHSCIAQYPGDFAIALTALGADVEIAGPVGSRIVAIERLHRDPAGEPQRETSLHPGEVITGFQIPAGPWTRRSLYLKIRDRDSYQFALASAAVALDLDGDRVRQARVALGGCAYRPWRAREAEAVLTGERLTEPAANAAAQSALRDAATRPGNAFKPELARRTLVRALLQASRIEV